ncbi:hypothetical protein UF75_5302 [Desulfosporosinus sp. I2]|nr:hypothetical protein UF75_5302 [Desulfosporosinus sp. I2]
MGTYAYKLPKKRHGNPWAYPKRKLYLNLRTASELSDRQYDFRFLTESEAQVQNENTYWFEVGNILNFEEFQVNEYLLEHDVLNVNNKEKSLFGNRTLFRLHSVIHKNQIINFYLEKSNDLDKVLNIFIRINNGGTKLNYTDLLLSIATAQWKNKDAREEINRLVDEINKIGDGFNFDKDFILKASLVLADFSNIAFKINNFKKENMLKIEEKWDEISESIKSAVLLVSTLGYNRETLTSHNSVIPIAYYLLKYGCPSNFEQSNKYKENRAVIHKWLTRSLLKRAFGAHPENVYRSIREVIGTDATDELFPLNKIMEKFKGNEKSIVFDDDEIENLFIYQYGQPYTFSALALLYPTLDYRNKFHIDHIFPKSLFKKSTLIKKGIDEAKIDAYLESFNSLANLQLMEGLQNQEKSDTDFKDWLKNTYSDEQNHKHYMAMNFIPEDIDLSLENFEEFIKERHKLMKLKYENILL